ncbi:response regulator transcription factor [Phormidium tenue FACHB-886]|nr:response regulator transcription factor [Phormidium tenue FACHB-886]
MKKILIVDDDITLRTALRRYLQNRGYCVMDAESGSEGLARIEQTLPDVVVSDIMMPEMDGLEFCRRLRSLRSGQLIPFIFLSGLSEVNHRVQGHQMGADGYLVKPFAPQELVAKIESQLERSRRLHSEIVRLMQRSPKPDPDSAPLPLTPAEEKVFWEVSLGFTNKQIADRLLLSSRTVQSHLSSILSKLQLESRAQLVRYAFECGERPLMETEERK